MWADAAPANRYLLLSSPQVKPKTAVDPFVCWTRVLPSVRVQPYNSLYSGCFGRGHRHWPAAA